MTKPTGKPVGRPPGKTYTVRFLLNLTENQHAWLKANGGAAKARELIERARNGNGQTSDRGGLERD